MQAGLKQGLQGEQAIRDYATAQMEGRIRAKTDERTRGLASGFVINEIVDAGLRTGSGARFGEVDTGAKNIVKDIQAQTKSIAIANRADVKQRFMAAGIEEQDVAMMMSRSNVLDMGGARRAQEMSNKYLGQGERFEQIKSGLQTGGFLAGTPEQMQKSLASIDELTKKLEPDKSSKT